MIKLLGYTTLMTLNGTESEGTVSSLPRRRFLQSVAAAAGGKTFAQSGRWRPNILYIHSHDTGRYIQPFGHSVPTPNLQRLADDGILFRRAFSTAPTCSPSRASLLTGMCPHSNGMLGLAGRGFALKDYRQHIIHTLRNAAGYYSALIGLQHVAENPDVIGYDRVVRCPGNKAVEVAPRAVEFLNQTPKQPFFLDVGFYETHRKYHKPGPNEDPRFCLPPNPIPDTPETRLDIAGFKASARVLDDAVGLVLGALEKNGLADDTFVISTTDHGIAFPAMKCNLTDHGTGVSLIMRGPGGFTIGRACDAMVSQIDVFPTLCDLLDIEHPSWLEGKSFMPVIRGEKKEINEELFAEVSYHAAYEPQRSVRTPRWKYIRRWDGRKHPNLPNCDDGYSKALWLESGWRDQPVAAEQLYDLIFDPNEVRNLADNPSQLVVLNEMRGRLDRWMRATNDPLLQGYVKAPAGAEVNDPNGTSPHELPRRIG